MSDTATRPDFQEPTRSVHTRLPESMVVELDRAAAADQRTRSWLVRQLIENHITDITDITEETK